VSIREAMDQLALKGLSNAIVVDCSHANSWKKHENQPIVWQDVINQKMDGNDAVVGLMLESNICEGNQKIAEDLKDLAYGVSITDACISWETTENLIRTAHEQLMRNRLSKTDATLENGNGRYSVSASA
jgi:3-deoxy-7-phosphoheptulonate synthase